MSTSLVSKPPKKVNPGKSGRPGHAAELHDVQLTAADKGAVILPLPPIPESQLGRENTPRNPGVGSLVHFLCFSFRDILLEELSFAFDLP